MKVLKKKYIKFLIIFVLTVPVFAYQKTVEGEKLRILAPATARTGNTVRFNSRNKQRQDVVLTYGKTTIYANEATLQETRNKIYIKGGFYSEYLDNKIIGDTVIYSPFTDFFEAKDVTVNSTKMVSKAESFSFYGEKITLRKARFGVDMIKLDIEFENIDFYPGWVVADQIFLKVFSLPILYTPTLVVDNRRNTYKLPSPLPEIGKTNFRGDYWRLNTHYYVNEFFYGNLQFGRATEKGAGYGGQYILRFSDYDQFTYINENWQYDRTQEVFSFEHSFMELPIKKKKRLTFNELLKYNDEIKDLPANTIRFNKTYFEETNDEIINRYQELIYEGRFVLPWQEIRLYTKDSAATIEEITSATEANKFEIMNEFEKDINLGAFGPITPGLGYDSIKYSLYPFNWHRLYDYVYLSRNWWIFKADARVTDYLDEKGASPFRFDQKYELHDNVKTNIYMDFFFNTTLGKTVQYSTYDGKLFDIIYHVKFKTNSWSLKADYSLKKDYWSASIEVDVF